MGLSNPQSDQLSHRLETNKPAGFQGEYSYARRS
jgi:hypothetical protein